MGITIHFSGYLKSPESYRKVTCLGREFARRKGAVVFELDTARKELLRVRGDEVKTYVTSVRGIEFLPHPDAEPVRLQFDQDDYLQEFCKTQYAGVAAHIDVISFLREIEQYFIDFQVIDEGDYWNTGDLDLLEKKFALLTGLIGRMREELDGLDGPKSD